MINLKIYTNINCKLYVDTVYKGFCTAGVLNQFSIQEGDYNIVLISFNQVDRSQYVTLGSYSVEDRNYYFKYEVNLTLCSDKILKADLCRYKSPKIISKFHNWYIAQSDNGMYGIIDNLYNTILPFEYNEIQPKGNNRCIIKSHDKVGLVTEQGKVLSCLYDSIESYHEMHIIEIENLKGLANRFGDVVLPCSFHNIAPTNTADRYIIQKYSLYNIVDTCGNLLLSDWYNDIRTLLGSTSNYIVAKYDKEGIISDDGTIILPIIYDYIGMLCNHLCESQLYITELGSSRGLVDNNGNELYKCEYDNIYLDEQPFGIYLEKNGKFGYHKGDVVLPCVYDSIIEAPYLDYEEHYRTWLVYAKNIYKTDVFDDKCNKIEWVYENIPSVIISNRSLVKKNGKYGYVDSNRYEVIPCIYESASDFRDGVAVVSKEGKEYSIDINGNIILP